MTDTIDIASGPDNHILSIAALLLTDTAQMGSIYFKYTVEVVDYGKIVTSGDIEISVRDRCQDPFGISLPPFLISSFRLHYVEGFGDFVMDVPDFTPDPARCSVTYSYTITKPSLSSYITFTEQSPIRFEMTETNNLDDVGSHTVTITGVTGEYLFQEFSYSFTLYLANPCELDLEFANIVTSLPADQIYTVTTESLTQPLTFTHDPFTLTEPANYDLCGPFIYTVTMDGGALPSTLPLITYDDAT